MAGPSSSNLGPKRSAKGTAALLVPVGNLVKAATGSWMPIFVLAIAFDWIGALLAFVVLKPLRVRWVARQKASAARA